MTKDYPNTMIKLKRPAEPQALKSKHEEHTNSLWDAWRRSQKMSFSDLYRHPDVQDRLLRRQHFKCAFCEVKLICDMKPVEHYRPKGGWQNVRGDQLVSPGYFWLAYKWTNLAISCYRCNSISCKGNLFPLFDATRRASPMTPDVSGELPLLLNPFEDEPSMHIQWNCSIPRGITERGWQTIKIFHLDTDTMLVDDRRDHYRVIRRIILEVESDYLPECQKAAKTIQLIDEVKGAAKYAGMTRCVFGEKIAELAHTWCPSVEFPIW